MSLGAQIRVAREAKQEDDKKVWSLRQFAARLDIEPSYLSKIERDELVPGEDLLCKIALNLGGDKDVWLALAGKVSQDLRDIIAKRPVLFASLIRQMKDLPDDALLRVAREVRDGQW
jgi:transcriptional regulator with XRE-family HTH domain